MSFSNSKKQNTGFKPLKRFGQHFLINRDIVTKIIKEINPNAADTILEIGPGKGVLTNHLMQNASKVYAIEIDRKLAAELSQQYPKLNVFCENALYFDFNQITSQPYKLVGNLPYNISALLIMRFGEYMQKFTEITIMIQKEMADRILAKPSTKQYGRLTVMTSIYFNCKRQFNVSSGAFFPQPKVQSTVMKLIPKKHIKMSACNVKYLQYIVKTAFAMRRKKISNSLATIFTHLELSNYGFSDLRAENLTVEDYCMLANLLRERDNHIL